MRSVKPRFVRRSRTPALVVLCALLPTLLGGCPEFRDESVNAIETAVRGIFDAALNLAFDQLRSDSTTGTTRR